MFFWQKPFRAYCSETLTLLALCCASSILGPLIMHCDLYAYLQGTNPAPTRQGLDNALQSASHLLVNTAAFEPIAAIGSRSIDAYDSQPGSMARTRDLPAEKRRANSRFGTAHSPVIDFRNNAPSFGPNLVDAKSQPPLRRSRLLVTEAAVHLEAASPPSQPHVAPDRPETVAHEAALSSSGAVSRPAVHGLRNRNDLNAFDQSNDAAQQQLHMFFIAAPVFFRRCSKKQAGGTSIEEAAIREKAASEKQEEMELVLRGAQLGTWCWFVDSGQLEFNERSWSMLGYDKEELPMQRVTWEELLHPEEASLVTALLDAHLNGSTPSFSAEYRIRRKSGQWLWVHGSGKILHRDPEGKALRGFGIHLDITERKESARLLAQAKEESDRIIRNFLDTLIVVNTSLQVIRVNQATCELLGYREQELIGRQVTMLFHDAPSLVHAAFAFYAEKREWPQESREELRNIELCYRHKNGYRLPMSFNINLLKDDNGAISGVLAGAKDVSHLRVALDKVAQQKQYIETLFDILPESLLALSPSRHIRKSNRAYSNLLATWTARLNVSERVFGELLLEMINVKQRENSTFTIHVQLGGVKGWFRCNSIFISVLEGVAAVVSIDDITSERQADEERQLLATVIEQTNDAVFIVSADEIVRYVNPMASRSSGYAAHELIGAPPPIYNSDLMDKSALALIKQTVFEGNSWQGYFRNRRKDGSVIEEHACIFPIRNEEGQVTNAVAVKRDITEQIKLQSQLLQAQKLEAIGQLAAGIAHEINTPMQYIQNNVTFLEQSFNKIHDLLVTLEQTDRKTLPPATAELLDSFDFGFFLEETPSSIQETQNGVNRVVKIVAAMKEFSHPGGNERTPTDLNHALENTLIVCRNEWKYVAELVTDYSPDLPLVPCFADQFNQAILNLVINASHAIQEQQQTTGSRPGRITITTRQNEDSVEIQIADNGCGIPPETRQHVYDPFFTTKEVGKGTGQGLAIVHDIIVKKHGGSIDFTTTPGEGTVFTIRLPATETLHQ